MRASAATLLALLILGASCAQAGNTTNPSFAWSENAGWMNFAPSSGPGVTVSSSALTGYAWSENFGFVSLAPIAGGVVNDGSGNLSGFAWGENAGWINFAPTSGGVHINGATGQFSGYAWGENIGWINFSIATPVVTSWRATDNLFKDSFE